LSAEDSQVDAKLDSEGVKGTRRSVSKNIVGSNCLCPRYVVTGERVSNEY